MEAEEHLHSIMYLLILESQVETVVKARQFTFHNVSINSVFFLTYAPLANIFTFHNVSINSQMKKLFISQPMKFTFHNVSINSRQNCTLVA